jgi:hydroxycarboxylate dehydrogenase B
MDYVTVAAPKLNAAVQAIFRAGGSNEREAKLVADHLVLANLSGHDSHGVGMVPQYIDSVVAGRAFVNKKLQVVTDAGAIVNTDGGRGLGQVMAYEAMELGIERARRLGACIVGLRNSHHIGRIGHWGEQCARAGMVSIHYVNVAHVRAAVAPFGGADARFGTNPYCTAIPTRSGEPILLDFATSRIAVGKVRVAFNKREQVGADILIDPHGRATTDPSVMFDAPLGALLPFGEHKGSGLALVAELLSAALTGGDTIPGTTADGVIINCMLTIVFDPKKLAPERDYQAEIDKMVAWVKASPVRPGVDRVRVAGEPERERRAKFGVEGISIDPTTWQQLVDAARAVKMPEGEFARLAGA